MMWISFVKTEDRGYVAKVDVAGTFARREDVERYVGKLVMVEGKYVKLKEAVKKLIDVLDENGYGEIVDEVIADLPCYDELAHNRSEP